ncbi:type II secretion system protein [uncultured Limosilactobacillus sp.]|uniref:type II secretion system protein n=1 Tax=uncultured Limosilactobacillus sp. TaxID=2837629 RepID=UPI0025F8DC47|nr:type II secretion system protein [uncultured Limosilactobacillus sp.]
MKRAGFTLVEMVIVLGIIGMILLTTTPPLMNGFQKWQHEQFWRELRQEWQFSQTTSMTSHQPTDIFYDPKTREVIFISTNHERTIKVPEQLRVQNAPSRVMKSSGYIQPGTWEFIDLLNHQEVLIRIQMAGGGYRIEKKRFSVG